ncbi:hypothetical protein Rmet_4759 (plasmid) [Cupriavidus metallidurans CH34]|uniref:Uncharacterized protein n=1 Tax=Cupriavidus metallidurans (strain ATCC 43123 / DSM 2839 / NBRC 102507 / CH34) TaxID=266264 RepID=Q1LE05_CUPMC|nr:hypothetical protein Rmet_4759 [Cupriavidus metallidurans CH34]
MISENGKDTPTARNGRHRARMGSCEFRPSSFIRTLTVGPGLSPDLLTPRGERGRSRARDNAPLAPATYRRWGIAPRPEDVTMPPRETSQRPEDLSTTVLF